ncbi:hypothetical protein PsYK624_086550 [Phanerochaete sordida]|uniref:BTB domain-containing protein n=1 Tax=Phanerochaete sordida TaxID=48140 RepID=A0A9P3LEG5_9APHY|nr:hypothetical protein PsYK624_086550 [Phanerochaete sordida]
MSKPLHTLAKVPSGGVLEDALADSLAGVPFNDVTFYAYTRRLPSGKVDRPRAVQANSRILKATSRFFRGLLSASASIGSSLGLSAQVPSKSTDGYEYDCDSDLEDEDDEIEALGSLLATPSDVYMDEDKVGQQSEDAHVETNSTITAAVNHVNTTRVVHLDSVAADTLEAVVFYLYTGNIYFLPLRSRGPKARQEAKALHGVMHPKRPMCSCKSIYRFAEEAGLEELKALAEAHLFAQLGKVNILEELFSKFSARYPDILRRQVDVFLASYWTPTTSTTLAPMVERVVRGELPHAAPVLTLLLGSIPYTPLLTAKPTSKADPPAPAKGPGKTKGAEPTKAPATVPAPLPPPPRTPSPDAPQDSAKDGAQGGDGAPAAKTDSPSGPVYTSAKFEGWFTQRPSSKGEPGKAAAKKAPSVDPGLAAWMGVDADKAKAKVKAG